MNPSIFSEKHEPSMPGIGDSPFQSNDKVDRKTVV